MLVSVPKGSWDLVTRVRVRVTILITPLKVLITLLTKSHDPPSILGVLFYWGDISFSSNRSGFLLSQLCCCLGFRVQGLGFRVE